MGFYFAAKLETVSTKKKLIALVVTFILSNVLTTLYYMMTDDANMVEYRRDEMNYGALMMNHLIYAGLFVFFFPYYYQRHEKPANGFLFGILMGALMFIPQALVVRAIWKVDINAIFFLNTTAHLIIGGIMGLATALIYGKAKS